MPTADFFPLLLAVPLLPLGAWLLQVLFGKGLPRGGDWLSTGAMLGAFSITVALYLRAYGLGEEAEFFVWSSESEQGWKWLVSHEGMNSGLANFRAGLWYDGLTAPLLAMVAGVSFLVHLFSTGYMQGNSRYIAYFAGLSLFSFAMLAMLISDNLLFVFMFWEVMGLCSFLLIGHDSMDLKRPRPRAAAASVKAFLTTRVGDVALLLGLAIVWNGFGTLQFHELAVAVPDMIERYQGWPNWLETAGLLIFLGAVGKSAQFPLHVWLPDAMEGPTPVSAMIHAATMVAAGVYLMARSFPVLAPGVLAVIAVLGAFTAFFAATIALTQDDLKKVLAYSTISQLGYMISAIGLGSPDGALFHVFTHGLFKAGLFLGAGAVIYACNHKQDLRKLGGLRGRMPVTYVSMLLCTAAISGVPFLSGFYSKDVILAFAAQGWGGGAGMVAMLPLVLLGLAAPLTVLYMFRMFLLTFSGEPRSDHARAAKEVPLPMSLPLVLLGFGALFGAMLWFAKPYPSNAAHEVAVILASASLALGLFAALLFFQFRKLDPSQVAAALGPWSRGARSLYGVDGFLHSTIVLPVLALGRSASRFDRRIVDGAVHGIGGLAVWVGAQFRRLQSGHIQRYLYLTYAGLLILILFALWRVR
ncbi:MAG: NADH-quinone oxidoreductase subunit L [Planctomycetes bacterium]|nr:NADH-quinone oxidoreductase subunit L [Planctomycetota bacterium]